MCCFYKYCNTKYDVCGNVRTAAVICEAKFPLDSVLRYYIILNNIL